MRSLVLGSLAAAVAMFILGFIFFGLLFPMALSPLAPDAAAAVQTALGTNLPASGSYAVPMDEAAWMAGPSAMVNFTAAGAVPTMPVAMIEGFVHMLLSALIIGLALRAVGGDFARQSRVVLVRPRRRLLHAPRRLGLVRLWLAHALVRLRRRRPHVHRRRLGAGALVHELGRTGIRGIAVSRTMSLLPGRGAAGG